MKLAGTRSRAVWALALGLALALWIGLAHGAALAQDAPAGALTLFEPVHGALDDDTTAEEWTFSGRAGQPVSLLAAATSGGLDPVLEVIGPDGARVAENDDLDSLVLDAGLEALTLPEDGDYTVRVTRYEGAAGETAGEYALIATPGFADVARQDTFDDRETTWVALGDGSLALTQGGLRLRAPAEGGQAGAAPSDAIPLRDFYYQATASLFGASEYAEFGLFFRIPEASGFLQGYTFMVNTAGQWRVNVRQDGGEFALRSWTADPALNAETWTLAVLARDTSLSFYANGALLGTFDDDRLTGAGTVALLAGTDAGQTSDVMVTFDDVIVTRRMGSTYRGFPLALAAWDDPDPAVLVAELADSGQVTPAPVHDLYVNARTLEATDPASLFELIGSEQAVYGDFLFGGSVLIVTDGESAGCGLLFRYQDDRNLDLAYVDRAGGFGIVQAQDGALTTNVYDKTIVSDETPNRLLIVAQGEQVTLYVNGALVAQETLTPTEGRAGAALLNYEDVVTDCVLGDMWVWPLGG